MALLLFLCLLLHVITPCLSSPWMNIRLTPAERANKLLEEMTLEEKFSMMAGVSGPYVGNIPGNTRLGIPALNMNDGPQGFRDDKHPGTTTAFPSGLTMAASWDRNLLYNFGVAMGEEFFKKGANVQLGPGMNVARVPLCGRNFEYVSGEDPYLGSELVLPVISGIQSQNVIANAKHFALNNQEFNRDTNSDNADERTRMELYYPPFRAAVEAGVGSFMCSYNKINSVYSCENPVTLGELKNSGAGSNISFNGWVMSDWGATHSLSVNEGLDQEMGSAKFFTQDSLSAAVSAGALSTAKIDDSVLRMLTPMFQMGLFDVNNTNSIANDVTSDGHNQLAREFSSASTVLLKNDNALLPLSDKNPIKIAFFGAAAYTSPVVSGGGSGYVSPKYIVSALQGVLNRFNISAPNRPGSCDSSLFLNDTDFVQQNNPFSFAADVNDCCKLCSLRYDCLFFSYQTETNICYFKTTNSGMTPNPKVVSGPCGISKYFWSCNSNNQCVSVLDGSDLDAVAELASESDINIVVGSQYSEEGADRNNLSLDNGQDSLINIVSSKSMRKNVIVVLSTTGAILTPWRNDITSLIMNFMPGQEAGNALADVLFGTVNPSGRLPLTMPNVENEVGFVPSEYPGVNLQSNYTEKLLIGYRWYTTKNIIPAFSFGHGLSYTRFYYSPLTINVNGSTFDDIDVTVSFSVANRGQISGNEVPQLYLSFPISSNSPSSQLKSFTKTSLLAGGAEENISFILKGRELSIWDSNFHCWKLVTGTFYVNVGASSTDIRQRSLFTV